jgi:inner membrane transporter RhtA
MASAIFCDLKRVITLRFGSKGNTNFSFLGAAFAVSAGACWALYIYFGQKVVRQNIGMHALSIAIVISALVLLPISATHNPTALMQK